MTEKNIANALPEKLYGANLLARVKALQSKKKPPTIKEMARSCGYLHRETGGEQIVEFQRELLIASGVIEHPSSKPPEVIEPLKVGALYKIYNAKAFLAQLGLKDGDQIEYRIRKTRNGPVAELIPLPKPLSERARSNGLDVEVPGSIEKPPEQEPMKLVLTPLAPGNNREHISV
jgi:hypothetical protein